MIVPILKIALRALARNKARSALTMLGIVIGVACVIAMVSLGQGAQKQVQDQISNMGANLLIVQAGSQRTGGMRGGAGTSTTLTEGDMAAILRNVPTVAAATPSISASVTLVVGNQNWSTRAEGVDTSYPAIRLRDVSQGQFFTDADVRSAARVAVIGQTVADVLFPGADPIGQMVRLRNLSFRVAGVLQARGQTRARNGVSRAIPRANSIADSGSPPSSIACRCQASLLNKYCRCADVAGRPSSFTCSAWSALMSIAASASIRSRRGFFMRQPH